MSQTMLGLLSIARLCWATPISQTMLGTPYSSDYAGPLLYPDHDGAISISQTMLGYPSRIFEGKVDIFLK
jgi:hypothetical protein